MSSGNIEDFHFILLLLYVLVVINCYQMIHVCMNTFPSVNVVVCNDNVGLIFIIEYRGVHQ